MKFEKKISITISGDARLPKHLVMHFLLFLQNVTPIFSTDHEDEKVEIEIVEKE